MRLRKRAVIDRSCLSKLLGLFVLGAVAGSSGDWIYVYNGIESYPPHDQLLIPILNLPWWVAPEFGLATLALSFLPMYLIKLLKLQPSNSSITAPLIVMAVYTLSGFTFWGNEISKLVAFSAIAGAIFFFLRLNLRWAVIGALGSVGGVTAELLISQTGYFEYTPAHQGVLGVPLWLLPVYFIAAVILSKWSFDINMCRRPSRL